MGGSQLVLDLVKVRVDARRLGQEIAVTLGIPFGRPRLEEGEPGLCFYFFIECPVLCVDYNVERVTNSWISRSRCWILAILAHFWTVIARSSTDQKGGSGVYA